MGSIAFSAGGWWESGFYWPSVADRADQNAQAAFDKPAALCQSSPGRSFLEG